MVAGVRCLEKSDSVLSRASAYRAHVWCVVRLVLSQNIALTAFSFLSSAFGVKGLCHGQECLEPPQQPQSLLHVGFFTNASAALSLTINILATTLIGYKAWCVHGLRCLTRDHD